MSRFIHELPKTELHVHIEGCLEPELMFELGRRNGIELPYGSADAVRRGYRFTDLQSFLDLYYQGVAVLLQEQDFYDLAFSYMRRASSQNVRHAEIFFDPQAHTGRGVSFETVLSGLNRALDDAEREWGVSSKLILCSCVTSLPNRRWRRSSRRSPIGTASWRSGSTPRSSAIRPRSSRPYSTRRGNRAS